MGALCSIIVLIILLTYAGYKVSILQGKKSIDIIQAVVENHFDDSYVFDSDQGLNFAVGVLDPFNPDTYKPLDPTFGRIRVTKTDWGINENGVYSLNNELETHICSSEELGLSGTNHKMWPINKSQE